MNVGMIRRRHVPSLGQTIPMHGVVYDGFSSTVLSSYGVYVVAISMSTAISLFELFLGFVGLSHDHCV